MKRLSIFSMFLLAVAFTALGWATQPNSQGWVILIDGEKGLENWNRIGDANWRAEGGAIVADKGKEGFLVSKTAYKDFEIYAEFWAETDTNSGIFIRASDPDSISLRNSYEVNIWDICPNPANATGAIATFAAVAVPLINTAGGKWNTYEISAKGTELAVRLNGVVTSSTNDDKYASGPFALQFGPGVKGVVGGPIKWRKVQIKPL